MMQSWLRARRLHKLVVDLPMPGRMAKAFRAGGATAPRCAMGRLTWRQWLTTRYGDGGATMIDRALGSVTERA